MKQHENGKEIHWVFVGNIACTIWAASGAPINVKGKWRHTSRRQDPFLGPLDPRPSLHATCIYGGCVNDEVYQPPMPQSLREWISQAIANVDESSYGVQRKNSNVMLTLADSLMEPVSSICMYTEFSCSFQVLCLLSVTVSKIHKFVITQIIYNSPVLCWQYQRVEFKHIWEHVPPPKRLFYFYHYPSEWGKWNIWRHKTRKSPHV
jgi:hypothetical protein